MPRLLPLLLATILVGGCQTATTPDASDRMDFAMSRLRMDLDRPVTEDGIPRSVNADGSVSTVESPDWTSGFHAGLFWMAYEVTRDPVFERAARAWTAVQEPEKYNRGTHDLGFMINDSFGQGYRLTGDSAYASVIVEAARSLATRFRPKVGLLQSWESGRWEFPVIIDNMMNLELLFNATRISGDSSFYRVAVTHANTTIRTHYRPDFSAFHVVDFDTLTGDIRGQTTAQGYADGSAWARGQSWGLYGFTMTYRETRDPRYLEHARHIADFLLSHPNRPEDGVPYWDYDAPEIPDAPRDASAGAILASALLELSEYAPEDAARYTAAADRILESLSAPPYIADDSVPPPFILTHSVGHLPASSEVSVPIIYADYYYVEALKRRKALR